MKPRSRIINGLAVCSVLLSALTLFLWARSGWVIDEFRWSAGHLHAREVCSAGGVIWFVDRRGPAANAKYDQDVRDSLSGPWPLGPFLRSRWVSPASEMHTDAAGNAVPYSAAWERYGVRHWAMIALLLLPSLAWLRHRHQAKGRCRACGYSLRSSAKRCPKCGMETQEAET